MPSWVGSAGAHPGDYRAASDRADPTYFAGSAARQVVIPGGVMERLCCRRSTTLATGSDVPISMGWSNSGVATSILVAGGSVLGLPAMVGRTGLEADPVPSAD